MLKLFARVLEFRLRIKFTSYSHVFWDFPGGSVAKTLWFP